MGMVRGRMGRMYAKYEDRQDQDWEREGEMVIYSTCLVLVSSLVSKLLLRCRSLPLSLQNKETSELKSSHEGSY